MRKRFALLTITALSALGMFASTAGAAGSFCYDVHVDAAGQSLVSQSGCQELPG